MVRELGGEGRGEERRNFNGGEGRGDVLIKIVLGSQEIGRAHV